MLKLQLLLVCLVTFGRISHGYETEGRCIWYDVCGKDPEPPNQNNPHCLNCAYDGPAKQLPDEFGKLLDDACPHLRQDLEGDLRLCCSPQQLNDLKNNFLMASAFLGRCPTCMYNFRKNFCDMTCRPDQSLFLKASYITGPKTDCKQTRQARSKFYIKEC
jgi:Niemann-Pick C1 protein